MKRLDRYVLALFLPASAGAVLALSGMFILIDVVLRRRQFAGLDTVDPLRFAVEYYAVRWPLILYMVLPMVPLLAGAFTFVRMARNNEVLPVASGGTSLRRLTVPVFAGAAVATAAMAAVDEAVLPRVVERLAQTEAILAERETSSYVLESDGTDFFYATEYDHVRREMRHCVQWVRIDAGGKVVERARARRALWDQDAGGWRLHDGVRTEYEHGRVRTIIVGGRLQVAEDPLPAEGYLVRSGVRPHLIRKGGFVARRYVQWRQAWKEAMAHPEIPFYWNRLLVKATFPLAPVLLVATGIPLVLGPLHRSLLRGITLAFLTGVAYVALALIGEDAANQMLVAPWVGALGPTALFAAGGVVQMTRLRT
jgi:lipopolysaccharide export LptBFGC system permease protein LptF